MKFSVAAATVNPETPEFSPEPLIDPWFTSLSHGIFMLFITKASFAGLELPRLLNEVKYSNIRGEQPF